jgi:hypothetical protein
MNCFAHAYRFVHADPHFIVGTSLPDWLGMIDRKSRVRRERAVEFEGHDEPSLQQLSRGIVQHHDDDRWFHESQSFAEIHVALTRELARLLTNEKTFRPYFVAHIVLEMLIDAELTVIDRGRLDQYYRQIQCVDAESLQTLVNRIAPRPTTKLAAFVARFMHERFLYDYLRDEGVAFRVHRMLSAIGAGTLPSVFVEWVGTARKVVHDSLDGLLQPPSNQPRFPLVRSPESAPVIRNP